jgi:hypothetical protein
MELNFKLHTMAEDEAPIRVDPGRIDLSFIALPVIFQKRVDGMLIEQLQRQCQPRLWASVKALQPNLPAYIVATVGDETDAKDAVKGLAKVIDLEGRSVVLNPVVLSFDGGKTHTSILVGFCYPDQQPQVILPRNDRILPITQ